MPCSLSQVCSQYFKSWILNSVGSQGSILSSHVWPCQYVSDSGISMLKSRLLVESSMETIKKHMIWRFSDFDCGKLEYTSLSGSSNTNGPRQSTDVASTSGA